MAQPSFGTFLRPRPDKKGIPLSIKSIQTGSSSVANATNSISVPISTVVPGNSLYTITYTPNLGAANNDALAAQVLAATSFQVARVGTTGVASFSWQVTEYFNVKTKLVGSFVQTGTTDNITLSTAVNINKCIVYVTAQSSNATTNTGNYMYTYSLSSSTNLSINAVNVSSGLSYIYQVLEFY